MMWIINITYFPNRCSEVNNNFHYLVVMVVTEQKRVLGSGDVIHMKKIKTQICTL